MINKSRRLLLVAIDLGIICVSCLSMMLLLSRGANFEADKMIYIMHAFILVVVILLTRHISGVYNVIWRHMDTRDSLLLIVSDCVAYIITGAIAKFFFLNKLSGIYMVNCYLTVIVLTLVSRFVYRWLTIRRNQTPNGEENIDFSKKERLAIIGAGEAGSMLVRELLSNPHSIYLPVCLFDADKSKVGKSINGVKVIGTDAELATKLERANVGTIAIAIPSISDNATRANLIKRCIDTGKRVIFYEFPKAIEPNAEKKQPKLRRINIQDLLNRDEVNLDMSEVTKFLHAKTIMVTGGGGSIGSEICRQVAFDEPKKLVIVDIYENNIYDIQQELIRKYGDRLNLSAEIASVRDREKMFELMEKHKPDVVFHAAAHKHVPLMENCCKEAVKNNIFGTKNVLDAAEANKVESFIMISTDKAVNPTNIMGATKRFCELMVQSRYNSETKFAAVRFGNVLGSNGSVIPLFTKQIEEGGPLTITDKRITRYFMTIPEAVELVLLAGAMAKPSQVFVLDMGKPVKIIDLAMTMIHLASLTPYIDIDIQEIGLRPGEKLYEELLMSDKNLDPTPVSKIFVERCNHVEREAIDVQLKALEAAIKFDEDAVYAAMRTAVPTFKEPGEINGNVA